MYKGKNHLKFLLTLSNINGKSSFRISKGGWFSVESFIVVQCFKPGLKCAELI